jgi:hypothetical protein
MGQSFSAGTPNGQVGAVVQIDPPPIPTMGERNRTPFVVKPGSPRQLNVFAVPGDLALSGQSGAGDAAGSDPGQFNPVQDAGAAGEDTPEGQPDPPGASSCGQQDSLSLARQGPFAPIQVDFFSPEFLGFLPCPHVNALKNTEIRTPKSEMGKAG